MSDTNAVIISLASELGFSFSEHRLVLHHGQSDHENMRNDVRNIGNDMRTVLANR